MNEKSARKLQLSRRIDGIHPAAAWSIRVASIVFALIVGGLLLLALGYSPLKAYGTIIDGSLGSKTFVRQTIIIGVVKWLQGGPWEAPPSGSQMIAQFAGNAKLPSVLGVHCGWIIVLVLTVLMFIYMRYTKHGYEIAVIGDSSNTARYAGMNVGRIMMRTMFLSGSISGLVGFIIVSGANHTLYDGVAGGVGFTAISVAWLAQLNPFAMIIIASMLAVLTKGSQTLNTRMQVPSTIADILTGFILLCMLGCEFFINYKISVRREKED